MKTMALVLMFLSSLTVAASAQDLAPQDEGMILDREGIPSTVAEDLAAPPPRPEEVDPDSDALPLSLAEPAQNAGVIYDAFSLGASGGYLRARGSENGTWFGGAQARLRFGFFAVEASVQFHQDRYDGDSVVVTQYPVQLTAFLYFIPEGPFRPYILGGVGWYYTNIDYRGDLSFMSDHTQNIFGEHLGAGAELFLAPNASLDADLRYIFLNPTTDQVIHRDFNYWQITLGLNIFF